MSSGGYAGFVLGIVLLLLTPVSADDDGRKPVAILGGPQRTLVETDLACTSRAVAAVGIQVPLPGTGGITRIRFGLRVRTAGGSWQPLEESSVPKTFHPTSTFASGHAFQFLTDPTIAADGAHGFVVAALARVRNEDTDESFGAIVLDRWTPEGGWSGWLELAVEPLPAGGGFPLDKPVVVAGDPGELLVTWWYRENVPRAPKRMGYRRSTDGGASWTGELIRDAEDDDASIQAWFAPQPAGAPGAPFFVGTTLATSPPVFRFLVGLPRGDGTLAFRHVHDADGAPLELRLTKASPLLPLPGGARLVTKAVPQLAVDPAGLREFYVAWHDDPAGDGDVDVFVAGVSWEGDHWTWQPTIRLDTTVAPGDAGGAGHDHADQFLPALTVDCAGDVHVTLYDDRRFVQHDTDENARFDLLLARSRDQGATFETRRLPAPFPDRVWLDLPLTHPFYRGPLEYNGIAWTLSPTGEREVWASAAGTSTLDPGESSVLWMLRVR